MHGAIDILLSYNTIKLHVLVSAHLLHVPVTSLDVVLVHFLHAVFSVEEGVSSEQT